VCRTHSTPLPPPLPARGAYHHQIQQSQVTQHEVARTTPSHILNHCPLSLMQIVNRVIELLVCKGGLPAGNNLHNSGSHATHDATSSSLLSHNYTHHVLALGYRKVLGYSARRSIAVLSLLFV
jgi:hypothetical protein